MSQLPSAIVLTTLFGLVYTTFGQCSSQDFGISYNGNKVFSVSSANETCTCLNYESPGLATFQTAVIPRLTVDTLTAGSGSSVIVNGTAVFNGHVEVEDGIAGPGIAPNRVLQVADQLAVGSLISLGGAYQCGGLRGYYYENTALDEPATCSQLDATLGFSWLGGPCTVCGSAGIACAGWSARWSGYLLAPVTGNVTLSIIADDGVRLWFDNRAQPLVSSWQAQNATWLTATVAMVQGRYYALRVEYFQQAFAYQLLLQWFWTGQTTVTIPSSNLCTAKGIQVDAGTSLFNGQVTFKGPTLFAGGIGSPTTTTTVAGPLHLQGATTITSSLASTSHATGALQVAGGVGISGALNTNGGTATGAGNVGIGGTLAVAGYATIGSNLTVGGVISGNGAQLVLSGQPDVAALTAQVASFASQLNALRTLVNTNECAANNGGCGSMTCVDLINGTTCTCAPGYFATAAKTCIDVNECASATNPCGAGTCANTAGSFTCTCNAHYVNANPTQPSSACITPPNFIPISLQSFFNLNLLVGCATAPLGSRTLNGVPLLFSTTTSPFAWQPTPTSSQGPPAFIDITPSVTITNAVYAYTSVSVWWGQPNAGPYVYVEFFGTGGAYHKSNMFCHQQIRDYNSAVGMPITAPTQQLTLACGVYVDIQAHALPSSFYGQTLQRVRFTDAVHQTGFQVAYVAALTIATL